MRQPSDIAIDRARRLYARQLSGKPEDEETGETVDVGALSEPDSRLSIQAISFHATWPALSRSDVNAEFPVPAPARTRLSVAPGL